MDPFNFADALLGVLAQRLAKRLCSKCREAYEPDEREVHLLLEEFCAEMLETPDFLADPVAARQRILDDWRQRYGDEQGRFRLHRAVGCPECNGGYKGRVGLHELMLGSPAIKEAIQERARASKVLTLALAEGMRTLRQDGIEKVLAGITDMVQISKVCVK